MLRFYDEFIKIAPDELTITAGFTQMPDGMAALFLSPTYCGSLEEGKRVLLPLRTFGKPLVDQIQPITYDTLTKSGDGRMPKGRHYFGQTQSLDGLQAKTIEVLIENTKQFSSPFSLISLAHFHGAASRVPVSKTAFALRQKHLMVEFVAGWEPQSLEEDQRHVLWAQVS